MIHAMIDSGATNNFIDREYADSLGLQYHDFKNARVVQAIDGRPLKTGPVSQWSEPTRMWIREHMEEISFFVTEVPHFPVILGIPWLTLHDPSISWSNRELQFASKYCQNHCLVAKVCHATDTEPIITLPKKYSEYWDVFNEKEAEKLPPHRPYDCAIDLVEGAPIPRGHLYSLTEPEQEALREFIETNLRKGFIRPSQSPAASPVMFVKKKSGELRLVVDYRALNNITKRNSYPLPLISDLLDRLRGAKVYTKLDLRGAYNLVRIREGDEWKTAFQTKFGLFESRVMNYGLCGAPATFQHFVNDIFQDYLDRFLIIYLDDFLVFSRSQSEHENHVKMVLQRLRDHGLYAKLEKCAFDLQEVDFLGYRISPLGLSMDPTKVSAVLEWRAPTNKKEVQRFLGFANYYRKFIPDFARWSDPITSCIRGKQPFRWTDQAEKGFQQLKKLFTSQPILQHPDPETLFVVQADASDVAIGAVLLQPVGDHLHPCAYYSRQLTAPERNYTIWEKELLAIKAAFETWRHWLEGAKFPIEVHTDHRNLEHLRTARKLNQRQQRWALFFERFNFQIHYVTPAQTKQADALSRKPEYAAGRKETFESQLLQPENFATLTVGNTKSTPIDSTPSTPGPICAQEIRASQQADAWTQDQLRQGLHFPFSLKDGLLCYRNHVYIPPGPGREKALRLCHDCKPAGHFGLFKTMHLILRDFWWPKIRKDVEKYVNTCPVCQRSKIRREKPSGLLHPLPTPSRPWEIISADFITDLPPSCGFTTILVVVDLFTKLAHFIPCEGLPTAQETADLFLQHVFRLHGLPKSLVTDRGSQFTSRFWKALQKLLGIDSRLSSAHHPQTDGQTERTNATLEQYLRCYVNYQQDNWASLLPLSEFAYNNGVQASTKETPFFANYGFHPRFFPPVIETSEVPAAEDWLQELTAVQQLLLQQLEQAKEDYKRHADKHRQPGPEIKVGDRVFLSTRFLPSHRPCRKLDARFIGPYPVVAQLNPVTFKLQLPRSMRIHPVFHRSLLLPADGVRPDVDRPAPVPILVDGEDEFEVQDILDSRFHRRRLQYLIDWVGFGPEERSWEDASTVHAPDLTRRFHQTYPAKPRPRASGRESQFGRGLEEGDSVMTHGPCSPAHDIVMPDEEENLGFLPSQSELDSSQTDSSQPDLGTLHLQEGYVPEVCQTNTEATSPVFSRHEFCKQQRGLEAASRRSARIAAKNLAN
uniref:Gypsy retrotransposon integrase-like protein 1 n=1 Tax=Anolis carolinensis TaxID=28377 RepID=A0A803T7I9_ANOCA